MNIVRRYTVYCLSLLLIYTPVLQSAAELSDAERRQISSQAQGLKGFIRGKNEISYEQAQQVFADIDKGNTEELKQAGSDIQKRNEYSSNYRTQINADAESTNSSDLGTAYRMIKEDQKVSTNRLKTIKTTDGSYLNIENSIFDNTKNVLDNIDNFAKEFGGCSESVTVSTQEQSVPNPEYRYCTRDFLKEQKYTILHKIDLEERSAAKREKNQNRSAIATRAAEYTPKIADYPVVKPVDNKLKLATSDGLSTVAFSQYAQMISFTSPMVLVNKSKLKILHPREIDAAYISNIQLPTMGKVLINGKVVVDRVHPQLRKDIFTRKALTKAQINAIDGNARHKTLAPALIALIDVPALVHAYKTGHKGEKTPSLPDEVYVTHNNAPSTYHKGSKMSVLANPNAKNRVLELFTTNPTRDGVYIDAGRELKNPPLGGKPGRGGSQEGSLKNVNEFINNPYIERAHIDITDELDDIKKDQDIDIEIWSLFINFPDPIMETCALNNLLCFFQHRAFYRDGTSPWPPAANQQRDAETKLSIIFDLGAKKQEIYTNDEALAIVAQGADENTKLTTTCKVMRSGIAHDDRTSCATIQGRNICPEDLIDSPKGLEHISKMCLEYEVKVERKVCYWKVESNEEEKYICEFRSEVPDACEPYRINPACSLAGHSCAKLNIPHHSSVNYIESNSACADDETTLEKWECGTPLKVKDHTVSSHYDCPGKITCMGTDCIGEDPEKDFASNFGQVTALIKAAEMAAQDSDCFDKDTQLPTDERMARCRIFVGKSQSCADPHFKIGGLGGGSSLIKMNSCCNPPGVTVNTKDYLGAMIKLARLHTGIMRLQDGNIIKGAYQTFQQPIANGVSYITKPITSAVENITASTKEFFKPVTDYVKDVIIKLKKKTAETIQKLFAKQTTTTTGQTATTTAAQQAAKTAGDKAAEAITNKVLESAIQGFNAIMLAYTVYQVGELANQILNACSDIAENQGTGYMQLAVNRKLKNCSAEPYSVRQKRRGKNFVKANTLVIKSYCCYNSPLARIFSEQVAKNLNLTAEEIAKRNEEDRKAIAAGKWVADPGTCGGVRISDLSKVDISKIDLREWTAMLQQNNLSLDPMKMNIEDLTGKGSDMAEAMEDPNRKNVVDRTVERLEPPGDDKYHYDKILNKQRYELEKSIRFD